MTDGKPAPLGNTGAVVSDVESIVGVGWITMVFSTKLFPNKRALLDCVLYVYTNSFRDVVTHTEVRARTYTDGYRTLHGSMLLFSPNRDDVCLSICQTAIERISMVDLLAFCHDINSAFPSVSRFDVFIDDRVGHLDLYGIRLALQNGWYVGRADRFRSVAEYSQKSKSSSGDTLYIGSRESECFVRFYDKALQQGIDTTWNRCELELKGDVAKRAFQLFLKSGNLTYIEGSAVSYVSRGTVFTIDELSVVNTLKGVILSKLDFRLPESNKNVTKRTRAEFWSKMLMDATSIPRVKSDNSTDIEKLKAWFEAAVAPSLSLLLDYHGVRAEYWLEEQVRIGRERRKARHTEMLLKGGA